MSNTKGLTSIDGTQKWIVCCLFEVITLGLFPSASWEEVVSLVQMLFVRSQTSEAASQDATEEIQANWNRTMAFPSPYPISSGTMLSLWHFSIYTWKTSHASLVLLRTHFCDILVPFALKCVGEKTRLCIASNASLIWKDWWCGCNHLVPDCASVADMYSIFKISCRLSGLCAVKLCAAATAKMWKV